MTNLILQASGGAKPIVFIILAVFVVVIMLILKAIKNMNTSTNKKVAIVLGLILGAVIIGVSVDRYNTRKHFSDMLEYYSAKRVSLVVASFEHTENLVRYGNCDMMHRINGGLVHCSNIDHFVQECDEIINECKQRLN